MVDKKQLGVFWGNSKLNFVESAGATPQKMLTIDYQASTPEMPSKKGTLETWEKELAAKIKNTIQQEKMPTSKVNLSLPTKDIIFRSFVIPWMVPAEIQNVVGFEVSKYIPFSLDKLSYAYHPITINNKGKKLIQIVFVAIKSSALEHYTKILKAATLRVNTIEPAASSLIRALSTKKLIPEDQTIALIEKDDVGRIIIIDNNIPQFVREFFIAPTSSEEEASDPESDVKKLTKEVRISLDYFNRQNEQLRVEKIFFLTSSDNDQLPQNLEKYLDIPVVAIAEKSVLEGLSESGVDTLNAYGTSIISACGSKVLFDLSGQKQEAFQAKGSATHVPFDIKLSIKAMAVCIPIIVLSIALSTLWSHKMKNEIAAFNEALGSFQDSDVSFIEKKDMSLTTKTEHYKKIRTKSDVAHFLLSIPNLLPEGAWLSSLDINYDDSATSVKENSQKTGRSRTGSAQNKSKNPKLVMAIDGYAYSENKNRQFRIVNQFLRTIKRSPDISKFFENIDLETTSTQKIDEHDVTYFKIVCKQTNEH